MNCCFRGIKILVIIFVISINCNCKGQQKTEQYPGPKKVTDKTIFPMRFSDDEWKDKLTVGQYNILRNKGTEAPFSGKYDHFFEKGLGVGYDYRRFFTRINAV